MDKVAKKGMTQLKEIMDVVDKVNDMEVLIQANRYVIDRCKLLEKSRAARLKVQLQVGDKVKIKDEKVSTRSAHLREAVGRVLKVNRSKASVEFADGRWSIPFTMLEKVER
jgi:hypothetical protein